MPRTRTRPRFQPQPPVSTFRVRILGGFYAPPEAEQVWREIEVAANQPLAELGEAIPFAFDFDDPHLWSFFLSGQPWDSATEYGLVESEGDIMGEPAPGKAARTLVRDVPFPGKKGDKEFLYIFDFGDEWHFGVQRVRTAETVAPKAHYPRVAAAHGEAPPQYPDLDDEEWEEEEEDEE